MLTPRTATMSVALTLSALGLLAGTCTAVTSASASSFGAPVRIDVGGPGLTAGDGTVWSPDRYVTGGTQVSSPGILTGGSDTAVYRTARSGLTGLRLPGLAAGKYQVTLMFAETTVHARGQRVERVVSEGEVKRSDLDVFASAGFGKAWSTSFSSTVKDGVLDLTFAPVKGQTQLAGLVVTPAGSAPATSATSSSTVPTSTSSTVPTTSTSSTTEPTTPTGSSRPSQLLDLRNWKLTVPVDSSHAGSPDEYLAPELATLTMAPYFMVDPTGAGVVFAANAGGKTTSGSGYPRSELREMANNGATEASWSTASGTHTMTITESVSRLTPVKPHIVVGQIHDAGDDVLVIRLEGTHLFVDHNGVDGATLTTDYQLGTVFTVKLVSAGGHVKTYYNGSVTPADDYPVSRTGCYFKAGAYVQSNPTKGHDAPDAWGSMTIFKLNVSHTG